MATQSVDQALAERVRAAAAELNYSASHLARSLVLGKTNTIAVVVPDLENPSFHGILRGLSRAAARNGYHILIADSAESVEEELVLAVETRRRCDGLVLCAPRMAEADLVGLLEEFRPVVLINRDVGSPSTPVVAADHRTALTRAARSALRLRSPVDGLPRRTARQRIERSSSGGGARLISMITRTSESRFFPCGATFDDGCATATRVLDSAATGVLAFNDLVATGLIGALTDQGVNGTEGHLGRRIRRHPVCSLSDPALDHGIRSGDRARPARLAADVGPAEQPPTRPRDLPPTEDRDPRQRGPSRRSATVKRSADPGPNPIAGYEDWPASGPIGRALRRRRRGEHEAGPGARPATAPRPSDRD